jgi:uncharacterized protein DUF5683/PEGA domain-containing protein
MKLRSVCAASLLLLTTATAHAQEPPAVASGTLTVLSRPSGAAFRMSGDQVVVGRTPATIQRVLVGRYRVESFEAGFENWNRTVMLDGLSADTLWMVLRAKTRAKAAARSALLPGWGQLYSGRTRHGWGYLAGGLAGGAALLITHLQYQQRVDEYDSIPNGDPNKPAAYFHAERAYDARTVTGAIVAGIWAINVIDAAALFPRVRVGAATLGLAPGAGGEPTVVWQARVQF